MTAEEKGLLGAKYYAAHPLYPLERTLADINLDVINLWGPTTDIISIGMGHSTLDDLLVEIAGHHGRTVAPDADPEKGYYFRSDHFEFAKQGVPALDPKGGRQYVGKSADFGKRKQDEYTAKDYHKPSDEVKPDWDLSGAVEDMQAPGRAGYRVAQEPKLPRVEARQRVPRHAARPCSRPRSHDRGRRHDRSCRPLRRGTSVMPGSKAPWIALALIVGAGAVVAAWLDVRYGWITPAFDAVAHQFYEVPLLAAVRRPRSSSSSAGTWRSARPTSTLGLLATPWLDSARAGLAGGLRRRLCDPGGHLDLRRQPAAGARR